MIFASVLVATLGLSGTAYAITNGQPDGDEHPFVGLVVFDVEGSPAWRCTGSLLSPTVVLVAGHCTDGADGGRVWFDEVVEGNPDYPWGGPSAVEGKPFTNPNYDGDKTMIKVGDVLPDFIPAEFLYSEKTKIYLGHFSLALAHVEKGLAVSLIDLVSFKNDSVREYLREFVTGLSSSEISTHSISSRSFTSKA